MLRVSRREMPLIVGGFAGGLLIAILLVWGWVMFSASSQESLTLTAPAGDLPSDSSGLIGYTYRNIATRLQEQRIVPRPVRELTFRATRVTWQDARRPDFARVGEIRGSINALAARDRNIIVRAVTVSDAEIYLEQTAAGGEWNYQRVINRMKQPDEGRPKTLFVITDLAVRNTRVRVNMPDRQFVINNLAAQLPRIDLSGPNLPAPQALIARATGSLAIDEEAHPFAIADARLQFAETGLDFRVGSITTGETRFTNLAGTFGESVPGIGLRVTGRADNVRFEDIRFVSPRLPETGTASFAFRLRPFSETLTEITLTEGRVQTGESNVTGDAVIHFGGETMELVSVDARFDPLALSLVEQLMGDTLPYRGTVTGTARGSGGIINFDVNTRLTSADVRTPFLTHLTGQARFSATGFELRRLDADLREVPLAALRAVIPGLPLSGAISGRVSLTGSPGDSPLSLDVRLELALGVAIVEGTVDLRGAQPVYDLSGRLLAVNLDQLIEPSVPPVFMSANFRLNGTGADPETMDARLHLDGRFTGWRAGPRDSLHADIAIRNGMATIDTAAVKLASMTGSARGSWRFAAPASGSIGYQLAFDPLTPFGPYIPGIGDEDAAGALRVTGTLSGQTGRIVLAGEATGSDLRVGQWGASALDSKYQLVLGPPVPEVQFNASARDLTTPTAGGYTTATAQLTLVSPAFALEINAERANGAGGIEILADGRIPPTGPREVILHRARLELGEEQWVLSNPAVFAWTPETNSPFTIRNLDFREEGGDGRVMIDGRVRPPASADFRVETVSLPVGDVQSLLGMQPVLSGELTADATILVTSGVPLINGRFQVVGAFVQDVAFSSLTGDVEYRDNRLIANAIAMVDTAGRLDLRAELPLDLHFGDSTVMRMRDAGPVRVTLVSDRIALAPFAVLFPEVKDVTGSMSANLSVTGTVQTPELSGTLALHNASMYVIPANQSYDSINAVVALENQRAVIQQFVARADGLATATGTIEFADLNRPVFNITGNLTNFRAAGVEGQTAAEVNGQVQLSGPMDAAVLTGNVTLSDGYFPVPTVFSSPLDDELAALALPGGMPDPNAARPSSFVDNLRIDDFVVNAGESLWFAMEGARAELTGRLVFDKAGEDIRITGTLTGERGQYTLQAGPIVRRFEVVSAEVRFLGETELNPRINIVASRLTVDQAGRQIDIRVRVGGTMRAPTLSLASANAGNIPESELLSFLLFGQSTFGLTGGSLVPGDALIAETFVGGAFELLSLELEDELIDAGVSFDIFQLRFGNQLASLTEPSVVVGEEFADDVFLTVESGLGALFGGTSGFGAWAIRVEWRIDPKSTLRVGLEPVNLQLGLRTFNLPQPLLNQANARQIKLDYRRRWSW